MATISLDSLGAAEPRVTTRRAARADTPPPVATQARGAGVARIKMRTLIVLRLIAVFGQGVVLSVARFGLGLTFPEAPCYLLIAASALLNLCLMISPASRRAARPWEAAGQLSFDIVQLSTLLYLTGGVSNPFSVLMIVPLTVAVATLPARWALAMAVLAGVLAVTLAIGAVPLSLGGSRVLQLPGLYRTGCTIALLMGMATTGGFAYWTASQASRMELALHVTETVLAREQRLSALGALAAAAAHELGTPLATISVVAKEMARETPEGPLREDAWLLMDEAQRCRGILRRLTDTPEAADTLRERMTLLQFVRELVAPYAGDPVVRAEAVVTGPSGIAAPDIWRKPEVLHALTSIVENAFDFAKTEILVTARFDAKFIAVEVRDDGPGFSVDVLERLGDPYITSRPSAEGSRTGHVGMGLGFFIAKTLLERTDARVAFRNGRPGGAIVTARWPRESVEATEAD